MSDDDQPEVPATAPAPDDAELAEVTAAYLDAAAAVEVAARSGDPAAFLSAAASYGVASERYGQVYERQLGAAMHGLLRAVEAEFRGGPCGGPGVVYAPRDEAPPVAAVREGAGGTWWVYRLESTVHDVESTGPDWRPVYADPQRLPR